MQNAPVEDNYRIKWVRELTTGRKLSILLQNRNGPCPLLAISNALLLRGNIDLHEDMSFVSEEQLIEKITEYIFRANPALKNGPEEVVANEQQNLADVIRTLPKLKRGIDVNVKFHSPDAFEFTAELSCFDMCRVRLMHGWMVDSEDDFSYTTFGRMSYNQLVDHIINMNDTDLKSDLEPEELEHQRLVTKLGAEFIEQNPSQLTIYGLHALIATVAENEICVFFRNNHFSTLTKRNGALYTLVSDLGYLNEPEIVWDKFIGIHGESEFFNAQFEIYDPFRGSDKADLILAEKLQAQENAKALTTSGASTKKQNPSGENSKSTAGASEDPDYALAKRLQQMEIDRTKPANSTKSTAKPKASSSSSSSRSQTAAKKESSSTWCSQQ